MLLLFYASFDAPIYFPKKFYPLKKLPTAPHIRFIRNYRQLTKPVYIFFEILD